MIVLHLNSLLRYRTDLAVSCRYHNLVLVAVVLLVYTHFFQSSAALAESSCKITRAAIRTASVIRGLKPRNEVPCILMDEEAVREAMHEALVEEIPTDYLLGDEIAWKMLGVLELDAQYLEELVELYTSQLAGFYDVRQKHYVMAGWIPEKMQTPIAIHELTHALQDQHFMLNKFLEVEGRDTDQMLARSALVEGDAMLVMSDYQRRVSGQASLDKETFPPAISLTNLFGGMLRIENNQKSLFFEKLLIFPYVTGVEFSGRLFRQGGYALLDKAYQDSPLTTEEVMHPDKYFVDMGKRRSDFKEFPRQLDRQGKQLRTDSLGEFVIANYLAIWLESSKAREVARGWGGDRFYLSRVGQKRYNFFWKTAWDTPEDAQEFNEAMSMVLKKRFGSDLSETVTSQQIGFSVDHFNDQALVGVLGITGRQVELELEAELEISPLASEVKEVY